MALNPLENSLYELRVFTQRWEMSRSESGKVWQEMDGKQQKLNKNIPYLNCGEIPVRTNADCDIRAERGSL